MKYFLLLLSILYVSVLHSQDSTINLPKDYLESITKRISELENKLDTKTDKALREFQKSEAKIKRKLYRIDSSKAKDVFATASEKYKALEQRLDNPGALTSYFPYLDTLKTSLKFIGGHKEFLSKAKDIDKKYPDALAKIKELETSLAKAENIKQFIKERKAFLKDKLSGLPFTKELKKLNKQAYYYSAQVAEYKEILKDPKKIESKAIELLSKTKVFQDFMRKNSQLASLFRLPGNGNDPGGSAASLQGLQTRAQVNSLIQARVGGDPAALAQVRQNMQAAQGQLNELKNKLNQYTNGSIGNTSSDIDQPDFKPNNQKTKSFLKRLEYGANIQSQKARYYFPVTSDIALSVGYKLNDKSIIGIGASYKVGLGSGWNNLRLSHEGIGLRSFIDVKIKGNFFISGGYEQNYRSLFNSIEQLQNYSAWQTSGLIGVSKKYKVGKKFNGNMQFLWDFMSYQQIPQTQAILFRVGYSLK